MEPRVYRESMAPDDLATFGINFRETDLWCAVAKEAYNEDLVEKVRGTVMRLRQELDAYIQLDPGFGRSLHPREVRPDAPPVARDMAEAGRLAGVGPMAAVAGAISERVGEVLRQHSSEVLVENGGDIFLYSREKRTVGLYAGSSPLSGRVGLQVEAPSGLGICSSSGTVGHSLSFGKADCVAILARSSCLADAYATAFANRVEVEADVERVLEEASRCKEILGVVVILGERLGACGNVQLRPLQARFDGRRL